MNIKATRQADIVRTALAAAILIGTAGCRAKPEAVDLAAKARAIHERILTVDTHCDTAFNLLRKDWKIGDRHDPALRSSGKIDLPRMAEGGLDAEFFAAFAAQGPRTPEGNAKARKEVLAIIEAIHAMAREYPGLVGIALTPEDAYRLKKDGRRAAYIGIENGYAVGNDLGLIRDYYDRGVRYITLCHSKDNDICDSSTDSADPEDRGLSAFGREVVRECNAAGHAGGRLSRFGPVVLRGARGLRGPRHRLPFLRPRHLRQSPQPDRRHAEGPGEARRRHADVLPLGLYPEALPEPGPGTRPSRSSRKNTTARECATTRTPAGGSTKNTKPSWRNIPREKATVRDLVDHIDHVVRVVGIDSRRDRHGLRRRRRGPRLRRRERDGPCHGGAPPAGLFRAGHRQDLGRELHARLPEGHRGLRTAQVLM